MATLAGQDQGWRSAEGSVAEAGPGVCPRPGARAPDQHPAWGHRKIWAMVRHDGHVVSLSCVGSGLSGVVLVVPSPLSGRSAMPPHEPTQRTMFCSQSSQAGSVFPGSTSVDPAFESGSRPSTRSVLHPCRVGGAPGSSKLLVVGGSWGGEAYPPLLVSYVSEPGVPYLEPLGASVVATCSPVGRRYS